MPFAVLRPSTLKAGFLAFTIALVCAEPLTRGAGEIGEPARHETTASREGLRALLSRLRADAAPGGTSLGTGQGAGVVQASLPVPATAPIELVRESFLRRARDSARHD